MKIYLDEQLGDYVAPLQTTHDVIFAGESGRSGRSDAWHFREAIADGRVLVTFNPRDFVYLHKLWTTLRTLGVVDSQHPGVLTCAPTKQWTSRDWRPAVEARLNSPVPSGTLLRWLPDSGIWREDAFRPEED